MQTFKITVDAVDIEDAKARALEWVLNTRYDTGDPVRLGHLVVEDEDGNEYGFGPDAIDFSRTTSYEIGSEVWVGTPARHVHGTILGYELRTYGKLGNGQPCRTYVIKMSGGACGGWTDSDCWPA